MSCSGGTGWRQNISSNLVVKLDKQRFCGAGDDRSARSFQFSGCDDRLPHDWDVAPRMLIAGKLGA